MILKNRVLGSRNGFTLVELLIVIAIIGLLATVAVIALGSSKMNARNARRKADLIQLKKALELYYLDNGGYPVTTSWYGSCSAYGGYYNTDPLAWIPGLVSGGYIQKLPSDPNSGKANPNAQDVFCRNNAANNCYLYRSNGTDYVVLAYCTPEGPWNNTDPFSISTSTRGWRVVSEINATTNAWY